MYFGSYSKYNAWRAIDSYKIYAKVFHKSTITNLARLKQNWKKLIN